MQYYRYMTVLFITFCLINITQLVFAEDLSIHQTNLNFVERISRLEEGQKAIVNEMRTRFQAVDERQKAIVNEMRTRFQAAEERQKAIVNEMRTRFQAVDERFEMMEKNWEKRFEALIREMNQRFEAVDKRFESVDKRFDLLINQNNARFDSLEKQNDNQTNLIIASFAAIIGLIAAMIGLTAYIIWDRNTTVKKALSEVSKNIEQLFQSHIEKFHTPESIEPKENGASMDSQEVASTDQTMQEFTIPKKIQDELRSVINYMRQFPEMRPVLN